MFNHLFIIVTHVISLFLVLLPYASEKQHSNIIVTMVMDYLSGIFHIISSLRDLMSDILLILRG